MTAFEARLRIDVPADLPLFRREGHVAQDRALRVVTEPDAVEADVVDVPARVRAQARALASLRELRRARHHRLFLHSWRVRSIVTPTSKSSARSAHPGPRSPPTSARPRDHRVLPTRRGWTDSGPESQCPFRANSCAGPRRHSGPEQVALWSGSGRRRRTPDTGRRLQSDHVHPTPHAPAAPAAHTAGSSMTKPGGPPGAAASTVVERKTARRGTGGPPCPTTPSALSGPTRPRSTPAPPRRPRKVGDAPMGFFTDTPAAAPWQSADLAPLTRERLCEAMDRAN